MEEYTFVKKNSTFAIDNMITYLLQYKIMSKSIYSLIFILFLPCILFCSCINKSETESRLQALEQENAKMKEERAQELEKENNLLKQQLADAKKEDIKEQYRSSSQSVDQVVPNQIIIKNADNAGVVLRYEPNERAKLSLKNGYDAPHFFTGDVLSCTGITGAYYQVYYDGYTYYIPKKYANPY